jgi:hypothetical protein
MATSPLPSAFELFTMSKDAVLRNRKAFLVIAALPALISLVGDYVSTGGFNSTSPYFLAASANSNGSFLSFLGLFLTVLLLPAVVNLELKAAEGKKDQEPEPIIRSSFSFFWRLIGLAILVGVLVAVGLLLLIVPGIILITRYFLSPYVLVSENLSIGEAMKRSAELSKGHAGAIWGVIGVSVLISVTSAVPVLGGILALVLGILYSCAPAMRYKQLSAK